jgi:predicted dehydrogenase
MTTRVAFAGFRHGHIFDLYRRARTRSDLTVVAACEEHVPTRAALAAGGEVALTHDRVSRMLAEVECDVVAVGDAYSRRGEIVCAALESGRHVIADKPICTRLEELDTIVRLSGRNRRSVGCMLDLRDGGLFLALRRVVRGGDIGTVHAMSFGGQHPLMYGRRAAWYFEEGQHGGTLNDLAIHAVDAIPWITGLRVAAVNAARNWNAVLPQVPWFKDSAQVMLTLENGCGVLGDVSYLIPDSFGYSIPQYWRMTLWGDRGLAETSATSPDVQAWVNGERTPRAVAAEPGRSGGYLDAFLAEIRNEPAAEGALTTADVLRASRVALLCQKVADGGGGGVAVPE